MDLEGRLFGVGVGTPGPWGRKAGFPLHVLLSSDMFMPSGQRHVTPPTANRQRWLQLPLFSPHGLVTEKMKQRVKSFYAVKGHFDYFLYF